jgi:hypothetical protein
MISPRRQPFKFDTLPCRIAKRVSINKEHNTFCLSPTSALEGVPKLHSTPAGLYQICYLPTVSRHPFSDRGTERTPFRLRNCSNGDTVVLWIRSLSFDTVSAENLKSSSYVPCLSSSDVLDPLQEGQESTRKDRTEICFPQAINQLRICLVPSLVVKVVVIRHRCGRVVIPKFDSRRASRRPHITQGRSTNLTTIYGKIHATQEMMARSLLIPYLTRSKTSFCSPI